MTYPPQQPGQGGWGQQPGGQYPQSGPQPGFGQQYPQQPGGQYPQSGPQQGFGQQPGGAYPPSGPQQQPGFGGPPPTSPYGQPGFEPPKKKSPLPWILGGVGGVVVIALVITLVVVLTGGGSPQAVAEKAVSALNSKDLNALNSVTCDAQKLQNEEELKSIDPAQNPEVPDELKQVTIDWSLAGEVKENGDEATAQISAKLNNVPEKYKSLMPSGDQTFEMKLIVESGDWKVCELNPA
ncbi:hypothetical protein ABT324_07990 [Saccharopolyspora sp. NPDC000359]|uniref:Rv0361 family membrane protein n=1 Tax=Saccharopolyspora sp. NPDC000359 TaxID=3154251 RepID=UPI00332181F4